MGKHVSVWREREACNTCPVTPLPLSPLHQQDGFYHNVERMNVEMGGFVQRGNKAVCFLILTWGCAVEYSFWSAVHFTKRSMLKMELTAMVVSLQGGNHNKAVALLDFTVHIVLFCINCSVRLFLIPKQRHVALRGTTLQIVYRLKFPVFRRGLQRNVFLL